MTVGACLFLPPYLLRRIADAADVPPDVREAAERCLRDDRLLRAEREGPAGGSPGSGATAWTVHTAENTTSLPGARRRSAGEPASGDAAVDEAAVAAAGALALFREAFGRESFDDAGAEVVISVHYGRDYANAFWNGAQLVFGDGDGRFFDRLTQPVDVLAHELTHAVTEHAAGLTYQGQPGALNESISDVFASCAKQRMLGQGVAEADWLIGAGLFLPGVRGRALRDLAAPGTAYDDPVLGRDRQVGHLDDYVDTADDDGGVHVNSGIPSRAFYLAATAIGGRSWEGAGAIWYAALTGPEVGATADFAGFAAATVAVAGEHADAVDEAWTRVGVIPSASAEVPTQHAPEGATVEVRRSGGFLGLTVSGRVDLAEGSQRAVRVRALLGRIDLRSAPRALPHPDMYTYSFRVPGQPEVEVAEQHLTDELRELAAAVLEDDVQG